MEQDTEFGTAEAVAVALRKTSTIFMVLEGRTHVVRMASPVLQGVVARDGTLLGRPFGQAFREVLGQGLLDLLDRAFAEDEPFTMREWRAELARPRGGPREYYIDFHLAPWHAEDGSVRGVFCEAVDVTDDVEARLDAEASGEASEQRYRDARDLVLTLQDVLLPPALPVLPGLQTSGRYLLAQHDTAVGGDWLDVVPLGNGCVALVVGDVVGHGVSASATMGQLRAVLGERLAAGVGIPGALRALDAYVDRLPKARATTLAVVELDPATGAMSYCTAGHPTPLVVSAGESRFLHPSGAGPLGTGSDFPVREDRLGADELLLLHSDGILERPGRAPPRATVELAAVARQVFRGEAFRREEELPVDRVSEETMELLVQQTGYTDDIALLAAQRVDPPRDLEVQLHADSGAAAFARAALSTWLVEYGLDVVDELGLQHALGECVTNVVEHAYVDRSSGDDRPLRVGARLEPDGTAVVEVADRGRWRPRSGSSVQRGRGLQMVDALVRHATILRSDEGTTVTLRVPLSRPVVLLDNAGSSAGRATPSEPGATSVDQADGVLTVRGALDGETTGDLRTGLLRLEATQDTDAVVDLTGVSLLASGAVRVLFEAVERAAARGVELHLVARPGSVADHVLELVGLEHDTASGDGDLPPL